MVEHLFLRFWGTKRLAAIYLLIPIKNQLSLGNG